MTNQNKIISELRFKTSLLFHPIRFKAPDFLVEGRYGEHIAVRHIPDLPLRAKFLTVAYNEDGEVRTAFVTSKPHKIRERGVIWSR